MGLWVDQSVPTDLIELGRIADPYGIKGWLNILPHSADSSALKNAKVWFIQLPVPGGYAAATRAANAASAKGVKPAPPTDLKPVRIAQSKMHSGRLVVEIQGLADRNLAEALKGGSIWVSRAQFPPLKKGEYYWIDLVGLSVVNREDVCLGTVEEVMDHGAHPILVVQPPETLPPGASSDSTSTPADVADSKPKTPAQAEEILIPFVPVYIDAVSLADKKITVDWQADY
ncbi:MAG: ribosome maturation factor RimM [Burkholderiales bacterium]|nr:ribosome maturation factor RimM [Burkholderiales bacterium]